jgi:hypothetical protein
MVTRRRWLEAAALCAATPLLRAGRKEFWDTKDSAAWSTQEKDIVLYQSPWARDGFARIEEKKSTEPGYNSNGTRGPQMPDLRPQSPTGGVNSFPIGQEIPPVPKVGGEPIQFRVLARWETAAPVRLAGGPEVPEMSGGFYVLRLRGLPLMPPPADNRAMLAAIESGSRLERNGKPAIPCAHLFAGAGKESTDVLLFFPRGTDPITIAEKIVTVESRFSVFHLSVKFMLKDMLYKGQLSL